MNLHILILAAGQGKRMHSRTPKVLHPVLFRPMLHHLLDRARKLPHASLSLVVGHGEADVRRACASYPELNYFVQDKQLGTAHAVRTAESFLAKHPGDAVLVLSGDVILLETETLRQFIADHEKSRSAISLLTMHLDDPTGYGRILRNGEGNIVDIREEADCQPDERHVKEVNAGIYLFSVEVLLDGLKQISNRNKQGEYYLPDVVKWCAGVAQKKVSGIHVADAEQCLGVNDRYALHLVEKSLMKQVNRALMLKGVAMQNPENTFVDPACDIAPDATIESGCVVVGSSIAGGAYLEANSRILRSQIGGNVRVKQGSYVEDSRVDENCSVGPYAHLRPGTHLMSDVKIGNFVELKKTTMGKNSKASHLSYVGDATVGADVNIGCGFITCNYDGVKKHETHIGDGVFIGSDTQVVAPVTIGNGAYIGAGSTITKNVPPDALAISRARQENREGYARRFKKDKKD